MPGDKTTINEQATAGMLTDHDTQPVHHTHIQSDVRDTHLYVTVSSRSQGRT